MATARDQNGVSSSYRGCVFELVVHEESESWTSVPHSFTISKAYCSSQVSRVCVPVVRILSNIMYMSAGDGCHNRAIQT